MPTTPNATESLSGGAGITAANFVKRVLERLEENPYTDVHTNSLNATDVTSTLTVADSSFAQKSGWIDWVEDGTLETALIIDIPNANTLTVRRGHRGSTKAIHAANAVFRYMGRYTPKIVSDIATDQLLQLWPELYEVRHVDWTISTSVTPELWYGTPTDAERFVLLYQRTNSTPVDLRTPGAWGGVHWIDSNFVADKRALQIYGTAITSPDNRLHGLYIARLALGTSVGAMTSDQIAILAYETAAATLETIASSESKPDRRANMGVVPTAVDNRTMFLQRAQMLKRREMERLQQYLPRRQRINYRGARHYSDYGFIVTHPVRPY